MVSSLRSIERGQLCFEQVLEPVHLPCPPGGSWEGDLLAQKSGSTQRRLSGTLELSKLACTHNIGLPLRCCPAARHMQGFSITLDEAFMRDLCMGRWGMVRVQQATGSHCRALHRSMWAACPRKVGARACLCAL